MHNAAALRLLAQWLSNVPELPGFGPVLTLTAEILPMCRGLAVS